MIMSWLLIAGYEFIDCDEQNYFNDLDNRNELNNKRWW